MIPEQSLDVTAGAPSRQAAVAHERRQGLLELDVKEVDLPIRDGHLKRVVLQGNRWAACAHADGRAESFRHSIRGGARRHGAERP